VLQAGRFFDRDGKKMMPFSITVHYAVADGYHVGLFLEKFQAAMCHPKSGLSRRNHLIVNDEDYFF
jgi:chloramphenicol O-acetyltransferase type A